MVGKHALIPLLLAALNRLSAVLVVGAGTGWCQWNVAEEAKLTTGGHGGQYDLFGAEVALSGNTALIGALRDDLAGTNAGAAYVFVRNGTNWSLEATLTASDPQANGEFGNAVALEGDTAVVGAWLNGGGVGAAYVFVRNGTIWSQQQKLTGDTPISFGASVAISGETVMVGQLVGAGSAYVFVRSGTIWSQQAVLIAGDPNADDAFGASISLEGDTAVIGALGDDQAGSGAGAAYVFVRSGTRWTQQQKLIASDTGSFDSFGGSVAISGDTVVVGALDAGPIYGQGAAYMFVQDGAGWNEQQKLTPTEVTGPAKFGKSVALLGDTLVVGANEYKLANGSTAGSAWVFARSGTTWEEMFQLTASDAAPGDEFGSSVAISGETLLVASPYDDHGGGTDAGSTYVYRLASSPTSYCTAGTSASGCQALLSASGTASATAATGFTLSAATVEGQKDGLFFFGTNGQQANPWGNGTSYQCVIPPVVRTPTTAGVGTIGLCDGSFALDLNALWCPTCPKPAKNPGPGATVQAQLWYRDPLSTSNQTTSLSDAVEFPVGL